MFSFQSIGSGSSGNSYYLQTEAGAVLIDAGVAIRRFRKQTHEYGISLGKVAAVFVTHHHIDHVRALGILNQKDGLPIYLSEETMRGIIYNPVITKKPDWERATLLTKGQPLNLQDMEITPFDVPHDSRDNTGYIVRHGQSTLCLVTDCGHWTDEIEQHVSQATHLVIEANYDPDMLRNGPYPVVLQNRIRNGKGHLSNIEAAEVISRHRHHLKHVWLCHLSEKNNTPALALQATQQAAAGAVEVVALDREKPSRKYVLEE
ncbi:MAG: MBL fold metallo-hydrolase [Prevotellaceae bacterium]|nr:MBL fold metallo-hydrolase [Prevotellaceae bacterium]